MRYRGAYNAIPSTRWNCFCCVNSKQFSNELHYKLNYSVELWCGVIWEGSSILFIVFLPFILGECSYCSIESILC